jgi:hypothetical protein
MDFTQVDLLEDTSEDINTLMLDEPLTLWPNDPPYENQLVNSLAAERKVDSRQQHENVASTSTDADEEAASESIVTGFGWSQGGISKVSTSAATGVGLGALLDTLDKQLAKVVASNESQASY